LAPTSISENEIGDRNLKPVLTQGRKENEAYKRFMTQASPRQSIPKRFCRPLFPNHLKKQDRAIGILDGYDLNLKTLCHVQAKNSKRCIFWH
jgi:hypothetical protein